MISGVVNVLLEATVRLTIQDANGQSFPIEVLLDTGFDGFLTLPPAVINPLGLPKKGIMRGVMADGNVHTFDTYQAVIIWDGRPQTVEAQDLDVRPTIGTALLQGHDLHIELVNGGSVTIQARSTP